MKNTIEQKQKKAIRYYDNLSKFYDWIAPKWYYHKARNFAIEKMNIRKGETLLNLPCGTGQDFEYFQEYLQNTGYVIGIDLSEGMLGQAKVKVKENNWNNIQILKGNATEINSEWLKENEGKPLVVDAIFCDLGLSGFPNWKAIIDNMISVLKPTGKIVILDWYIPKPTIRGAFIKWIGKGEVDRPIYQYVETKTTDFSVSFFNRGGVFVATGIKEK
jgi:ubiquinone/menaquinone biosynthesis C-methylase UbiE